MYLSNLPQITPSPDLSWHPCYTYINPSFLCARLTVPMDYDRPLNASPHNPQVHLALLLLPAQQSSSSQNGKPNRTLKSPLLVNPGGPGGSGVSLALLVGPSMQKILGADQPILGFDPRGIMFTTPRADCWAKPPPESCRPQYHHRNGQGGGDKPVQSPGCEEDVTTGLLHRLEWENTNAAYGLMSESEVAVRYLDAAQRGVNWLCRWKDGMVEERGGSVLRWAGTRNVARDMVQIVEAWGRWVDTLDGVVTDEMRGKLVYWGFSYGTYLGATFARMFPERVGRLLLDGVVDAEFYEGDVWKESLLDADKVLETFFQFCVEAGRRCDLYRPGDEAVDVQRRYEAVMERLEATPLTFNHPEKHYPVLVRASTIKMVVFSILYSPIQGFPVLATVLNHVFEDNHEALGALFQDPQLLCTISGNPAVLGMLTDAQRAIMCSDKTHPVSHPLPQSPQITNICQVNMTVPEITTAYQAMAATSQFADIWMNLMLKCNGWDISPPNQIPTDPWTLSNQIETANPILFLSNTYDPVTPLKAAVKMALKFKGAGLLEQKAQGHCTISTVSRCTGKIVREYVTTGKLPGPPTGVDEEFRGEWQQCGVDEVPWKSVGSSEAQAWAVEEREMAEGWRHLQKVMETMQRWGLARMGKERELDMADLMALAREQAL
jgi:pimeloyl-ACP methyl ester carboxylesterase